MFSITMFLFASNETINYFNETSKLSMTPFSRFGLESQKQLEEA